MFRRLLTLVAAGAMLAALLPASPALAGPTDYIEMSDGIQIAMNVRMPDNFEEGKAYPTIFEMSGYDGGSSDGDEPHSGSEAKGAAASRSSSTATTSRSTRRFEERVARAVSSTSSRGGALSTVARSSSGSPSSRGATATSVSTVTPTAASPAS